MAKDVPARPLVITLAGDLDIYGVENLNKALAPANDCADVVIDMTAVRYIDSSALTAFVRMRKHRATVDFPPCRLVGLNENLRRLFEIVNLSQVWPMYATLAEALDSFSVAS